MATNYEVLRRVHLFSAFSDDECNALGAVLRPRRVAATTKIFEQGAAGDTMVVVVEGHLSVELTDRSGKRTVIGEMQPGEIVGEMAVVDPAPRSTTVTAVSNALIYELSRDGLLRLRVSSPSAAAAIIGAVIQGVTRRLRAVDDRIEKRLHPEAHAAAAPKQQDAAEAAAAPAQDSLFSRIWSRLSGD